MNARQLMSPGPAVVSPGDAVALAARMMRGHDVGIIPVVADAPYGLLVGVITDRDIVVRCVAEGHMDCVVGDHMTRDPLITVREEADIQTIADAMGHHQVRRLPVVNAANQVVGMVTQADLARQVGPDDPRLVERVLEQVSAPGMAGAR